MILIFFNCKSNKDSLEIYFFDNEISSPIQADCNLIHSFYGLKKIEISDRKTIEKVLKEMKSLKYSNLDYAIDVRTNVIVNKDTLCLDLFNNVLLNGKRIDSLSSVELSSFIKETIKKNKSEAKIINKHPELPLDNQ